MFKVKKIHFRKAVFCLVSILLASCAPLTSMVSSDQTGLPENQESFLTDHYRSPNHDLLVNVDAGSDAYIFYNDYYDTNPVWSPDGSQIAFTSNRDGDNDIYIMDANGENLKNITLDPSPQLTSLMYIIDKSNDGWPAWSPDGNLIAFSSGRDNIMMRSVDLNLYLMKPDGSQVRNLTYTGVDEGVPGWGPDGKKLVLAQVVNDSVNILTINRDGKGSLVLTDTQDNNNYPSWSPDGSRIAFESDRDGDFDIYLMDPDGTNLVQLTDLPGDETRPAWSPDGEQIALACDRDGDMEIYLMGKDGSNLVQLTENEVYDSDPNWSPDGKYLVYQSNQPGKMRIFRIEIATKEITQLTGGPVEDLPGEDGIYFLHQGIAQLWMTAGTENGSYSDVVHTLTESIRLELEIGESYLARSLAYLFDCEFIWSHRIGTEIQILHREDKCSEYPLAIADLEKALELGLAPGVQPGAESLLAGLVGN